MLNTLPEWKTLEAHYDSIKDQKMRDWFVQDTQRFSTMSIRCDEILFDYSKNRILAESIQLLTNL
ncbi:MAG TPA: glucose-6-phosphate isomerase, partial [Gammaproteobacteria bacterium]|nr:glucose-6-phosphate isomerase [Gammaproteobacteria bacterium]